MIRYRTYQDNREKSLTRGKWYARAVHELVEFDEFVEHMARHHSPYSEGTIRGVLIEMENCLREMLLEGKAVRFDELGIFRLGMNTKAANSKAEFGRQNIQGIHMCLYLGKRFRAARLFDDARFKEADKYIGNGSYVPSLDDEDAATDEP